MELSEMTLQDVLARIAELDAEVRDAEDVELVKAKTEEKKALLERKAELEELEERKKAAAELTTGKAKPDKVIEIAKGEERKMDIKELRNSQKYIEAYAEYIKTGKDEEVRALLTETGSGTIAVPDMVYDIIKTAWDSEELMSLIDKANIVGNLKVNFEITSSDAVVHTEGNTETEGSITEGIATLTPAYVMKWISVSAEALALRGAAFLDYIYKALAYKITKKMADNLVAAIVALPTTATSTSPSAPQVAAEPAVGTVASAIGYLSDEAANPVVIMNKLTWSAFKAAQYANGFSVDPFEGLKVCFNNTLPAYSAASEGDVYAIVGDVKYGALANFPAGENIEFIFDPYTKKTSGLVEIQGQEYAAIGVIADSAFVNITKPAEG